MELKTIRIFIQNFKFIIKLSFFSIILGVLSLGVLLPVFQVGFGYIFTKMVKEESVYYKNLFKFLNKTFILSGLWIILLFIFVITMMGIFLPVFVIAFFMYSPFILANEETGIFRAMQRSCEIVLKNGIFKHIIIAIISIIIFLIGLVPFGLGIFVTFPVISGYIGMKYEGYVQKEFENSAKIVRK